jgi:hypothetical protein
MKYPGRSPPLSAGRVRTGALEREVAGGTGPLTEDSPIL